MPQTGQRTIKQSNKGNRQMNILPDSDPMFSYPQNIQDLIYLLAGIIEEKRRERTEAANAAMQGRKMVGQPWTPGKKKAEAPINR